MVNSINSFYHNNQKSLLDTISVYIITDKKDGLDLSKLNPNVNPIVLGEEELSYDYSTLPVKLSHLKYHTYFRWEVFNNSVFNDIDNLLYLDCDTEVCSSLEDLFLPKTTPTIGLVSENMNYLTINHNITTKYYFNSGVMLCTPKLLSEASKEMFTLLVTFAKNHNFTYSDQDALNMVLSGGDYSRYIVMLGNTYNSFLGTWKDGVAPDNPRIIHHAGSNRSKFYALKYI